MRGYSLASAAVGMAALFVSTVVADVDPIVIKGSKFFFEGNGTQFFMKGIAYQQDIAQSGEGTISGDDDFQDPLANVEACRRDVPLLAELRTNTIRVYAIDPEADHEECMSLLQDAGIYVIADLSQPALSINRNEPEWTTELYDRYTAVVDELAQYSNTLGFFAGNEVSNQRNNTGASAFVKAAVRDTKAYIRSRDYRPMGVGYATNDDEDIREDLADYFLCDSREDSIDFFGYNIYSWCGQSSIRRSGFDERTREFEDYSVPVFFAEYGCNEADPRPFTEVQALYGPEMTPVWSGGIVYMYFQEENDYGLVQIQNGRARKLRDFENLARQMARISPRGVQMDEYEPTNTDLRDCPSTGNSWEAVASPLPPTPNRQLCSCMFNASSCTVSSEVDEDDYEDFFGVVCGLANGICDGIAADPEEGNYGAFGMCGARSQLAFALNQYYLSQDESPDACDFSGSATLTTPEETPDSCLALLDEAGDDGTGTVTSAPRGGGGGGGGDGDGDGGDGSDGGDGEDEDGEGGGDDDAAIPGLSFARVDLGAVQIGAYVVCAVLSGVGMILL